jgi:methionyl-tRNA synthetase
MNKEILNNESLINYIKTNPWIILVLVWTLVWKGLAMWKASKNNHLAIFILLLILNTVGIGEIIYLGYWYFKTKNAPKV